MPNPQRPIVDEAAPPGGGGAFEMFKRYGAYVLLGLAVGVLVFEIFHVRAIDARRHQQGAWEQFYTAMTPADIQNNVISLYHIRPLDALAYVRIGDFYLHVLRLGAPAGGLAGVKVSARQAEQGASHAFNMVLKKYQDQRLAVRLAQMGLGTLAEDQGNFSKAASLYKKLAATKAGKKSTSFIAQTAAWRLKHMHGWERPPLLAKAKTAQFKLPSLNLPGAFGPQMPAGLTNLPDNGPAPALPHTKAAPAGIKPKPPVGEKAVPKPVPPKPSTKHEATPAPVTSTAAPHTAGNASSAGKPATLPKP